MISSFYCNYHIGYCCIVYMKCDATSFELNNGGVGANTMAKQGADCTEDFVLIEGSNQAGVGNVNLNDKYCGGILGTVTDATVDAKIKDCTAPFEVGIITDNTMDAMASAAAGGNSGVCLTYTQEPCSAGNQGP